MLFLLIWYHRGKTAAQNRWIAYNKSKGQYSSAMEHAVPEEFWIDRTKCKYTDADGKVQNPTLQACAEGISAVKAIAIAQSQGQKIYTINKENRDTALPKLTIGGAVGDEIRNAINAGKEVTFHESTINAFGWSGHGYIILDPETGVGAHLIDGGGNGGLMLILAGVIILLWAIMEMSVAPLLSVEAFIMMIVAGALITAGLALAHDNERLCGAAMATALAGLSMFLKLPIKNPHAAAAIPLIVLASSRSYLGGSVCKK